MAHVKHGFAFQGLAVFQQLFDHHRSGLVMAAAETHLGIDDHVDSCPGKILVILCPDGNLVAYDDGLEVALPGGIPILFFHQFYGMGHAELPAGEAAQQGLQIGLGKQFLRDEGVQERFLDRETVEPEVGNFRLDDLRPLFAERLDLDMYGDIVHNATE